jgi:hypothetical protein
MLPRYLMRKMNPSQRIAQTLSHMRCMAANSDSAYKKDVAEAKITESYEPKDLRDKTHTPAVQKALDVNDHLFVHFSRMARKSYLLT